MSSNPIGTGVAAIFLFLIITIAVLLFGATLFSIVNRGIYGAYMYMLTPLEQPAQDASGFQIVWFLFSAARVIVGMVSTIILTILVGLLSVFEMIVWGILSIPYNLLTGSDCEWSHRIPQDYYGIWRFRCRF